MSQPYCLGLQGLFDLGILTYGYDHVDSACKVTEPLFNIGNCASYNALQAVFGHGLTDPAFSNALMFSVLHAVNNGKMTTEALMYKGEAIRLLNRRMFLLEEAMSERSLGAIMVLTGVEV